MGKRGDTFKGEMFRAQVRMLLQEGLSAAAITKRLGRSYEHTKRIVEQEREYLARATGAQA